jgi:hypothetical protein
MKFASLLSLLVLFAVALLPTGGFAQTQTTEKMLKDILGANTSSGYAPQATAANALVNKNRVVAINANTPGSVAITGAVTLTSAAGNVATVSNATGVLNPVTVIAETATGTLAAAECYGSIITNTGAAGAIVLTLPTPAVGMHIRVYLTAAQDVDLNAANGTQILVLTNATGDAISSAGAIGNSIELVALSATTWGQIAASGVWTDVN